jgi:hypothetical protein
MSIYRILGSKIFECSSGHLFNAQIQYEYSNKKTWFEVTQKGGEWIPPHDRTGRTFLPMCPECGEALSCDEMTVVSENRVKNVHVPDTEAAAVAIHPVTGEAVFCFERPDSPMPETYRQEGFTKVQFNHYRDLERFNRERGLVSDIEGDWSKEGEGFFEEDLKKRRKLESEHRERYLEEREKAKKAGLIP